MIKTRKDLKFYLKEDAKRNDYTNYLKYLAGIIIGGEQARAFHYLKTLRYGEFHLNNGHNPYHKFMFSYYRFLKRHLGLKYHIFIPYNSAGYGLRILHMTGGGGVCLDIKKCGNYCGFNAGALLGEDEMHKGRPVLGNHVAFGPGSKAIGEISIGSNVFVAPNVVVNRNIPDDSYVFTSPAKIVTKDL